MVIIMSRFTGNGQLHWKDLQGRAGSKTDAASAACRKRQSGGRMMPGIWLKEGEEDG